MIIKNTFFVVEIQKNLGMSYKTIRKVYELENEILVLEDGKSLREISKKQFEILRNNWN